ncbi:hypothetical protein RHMOL_Rhmol04G0128100 [Rhododendron molle]|uniref:Uncharacterized protein n=1 Tax=Rhododendron molle TaxID=49168 RepID=A0ACC0NZT2_RHOML|nr:hypothetical protein RHMOL_Rhmol04G0128100 [Rhododendron molle]
MEEDEEHGILLGMSQDSPLLQMSKFFRTLALSPWNDIVDPPHSDSQGAPIFDDKGRLVPCDGCRSPFLLGWSKNTSR